MKSIQIFGTLIALAFMLIVGVVVRYTTAADVSTSAEIVNEAPLVDTIRFSTTAYGTDNLVSSGILPNVGTSRTIHVNGQISDANGESDIASSTINLVFHKTTSTNTCTADNNDCYRIATCDTNYADGDDTQVSYNCEVPIQYWIDATDTSSIAASDNWTAYVTVADLTATQGSLSATIEVNSLLALNLPDAIDYGTRLLGEQSSSTTNIHTPITQRGNTKADVEVKGGRMNCTALGSLATSSQAWALTDVDTASSVTLTDVFVATERNINLRTSETTELSETLYWNIAIPQTGVKGTCTGSNTILIVAQPAGASGSILAFAAGANHSLAIKSNSTLYAWGQNGDNQLGLGDTNDRDTPNQIGSDTNWQTVSAGRYHTLAVKTNGTLYAWGYNGSGQLGLGDGIDRNTPTQVGTDTNWQTVAVGGYHTLAVKTNGTLYAWGQNSSGQLGLGDITARNAPVQVGTDTNWQTVSTGRYHTLAVKTNGTLWAWGQGLSGQLGLGDNSARDTPTQVGTDTNWQTVAGGGDHTLAVKTNGTLYAWGYNGGGQLGLGDTSARNTPIQVGTDTNWQTVAASDHSLALKTNSSLYAWGDGWAGQLGLGDTNGHTAPMQVGTDTDWQAIAAGEYFTLGLKTDGTFFAWGDNSYGQLGLGDTTQRNSPTEIPGTSFASAILPERARRSVAT